MKRSQWILLLVSTISAGVGAFGCKAGGVGDPCIPEDEYNPEFSGFGEAEANVESRSFQCETRVCIANHFKGRVSCPYGQTEDVANANAAAYTAHQPIPGGTPGPCFVPASDIPVTKPVAPQAIKRRAQDTVYCSCRCEGPDKTANYCDCPSGYTCSPLVPDLGLGQAQLVGKYCLKNGTEYPGQLNSADCAADQCPSEGGQAADQNPSPSQ
jgi:hypothetical protein